MALARLNRTFPKGVGQEDKASPVDLDMPGTNPGPFEQEQRKLAGTEILDTNTAKKT
jgi:hypothetical protein